ncbi:hypothetical protein EV141_1221 [Microcella putealis]|uniref:Uncharacterized protein n=1 Tax=Microcella putealis TaxID=337005 RepID=A0A4Q7LU32_9MICO|nr:hypothetical protein [Microcella putealis]RZS57508.1 hypothetical protein EV141_1221 [Microcella putealis]TQM24575.1 hypothetical protein BJ957_0830 [Microcella putealis]
MTADRENSPGRSRASEHLDAALIPGTRSVLQRSAAYLGSIVIAAVGYVDVDVVPRDLLITRRGSGAVVYRTAAGRGEEAEALLTAVRADLDRLTVEEFIREWSLTPES